MTQERWRFFPRLANQWLHTLTPAGRCVTIGVLIAVGVGGRSLEMPVYYLFCVLSILCLFTVIGGTLLRPRVAITADFPDRASAGQPFRARFRLFGRARIPAYDVSVRFFQNVRHLTPTEPPAIAEIRRGQSASLTLEFLPRKRGLYPLPRLRAYSSFPFDLGRSAGTAWQPRPLLVLPSFHPLTAVNVPVGERYQPGGVTLTSNVGQSPEYIGNRDYVPGDNPRRIDFHAWARLARPVVREYQQEYYCRIALVLDTFIAPRRREGRDGFPDLEAAVSLAASVADCLTHGEHIIDIFAAGPELYVFRAGRHLAHLDNILEILACVDACRSNPFDTIAPALQEELGNITSVVYVLLDWDETRERFVQAAVEAGCRTKVVIVREKETSRDYSAAQDWAGPITVLSPAEIQKGTVESL